MQVTLLGTGSPLPSPDRAGPATLVRTEGAAILFDCGRGVVMRLAQAQLVPVMLSGVVLTHLHSDHVCDLNDVITTHWVMSAPGSALRIFGPVGTKAFVAASLAALSGDISYRLAHHDDLREGPKVEVTDVEPGDTFEVGGLDVLVGATDHRPVVPSLGFRIEEKGVSVVIAGDGVPCATLDALVVGATGYVQSVIRDDLVRQIPSARLQDILDYHSTVGQAAQTAQRGRVKVLVLTHYVPAPAPGSDGEWTALARDFEGEVVMGDDMTTVDLAPYGQ